MSPKFQHLLGLSASGFHRIAYREWVPEAADGATAPTVVCVHGLTRNGADFDGLATALADEGYRVICPDVVGRGGSDRLADPSGYGYPQYLADMTVLLARLDVEAVDWIGTSMGALIGMMLAAQPRMPIRSLVCNDAGPFLPKAALERIASYVGQNPLFENFADAETFARETYAGFGQLNDEQWRKLTRDSVVECSDGGYRLNYDPGIAAAFNEVELRDVSLWPIWDRIACRTLVLRGADSDLLLEKTAQEMVTRGPDTEMVTIPDCAHAPALVDQNQIAILRDWLARNR